MKDILVTGAYGGMGKAAITAFKELGWRVFALDKRVDAAEENIIPIEADITDKESVNNALSTVRNYTD